MSLPNDSNAGFSMLSSKLTSDLSSIFASPKKAIFAGLGSSRLLAFDQVFAYIINVHKDKQPSFSCAGVIAFDSLPVDGDIKDIKVNADLTKAVLVGKRYTYAFTIPDTRIIGEIHRASAKNSNDLMENKIVVNLTTLGTIPNNTNILKVTWLSSTIVKKTYQFADFIGILYADSIIKVIDVKYPQKEYSFDFRQAISDSVQEEQFKGMGFSKTVITFDFGPVFDNKNFFTIFAVDSDSEIYYTSLSTLNSNVIVNPILGPILAKNGNVSLEPIDITFIKHPHSDSISLFALALDNGTISHILALPVNDWSLMVKDHECLSFFVQDSINLQINFGFQITYDYSSPGEYMVFTPQNIYMISTLPWLNEFIRSLQQDNYIPQNMPSIACHVFHLVVGTGIFNSAVILSDPPIAEDYDRYVIAYDSESVLHNRLVSRFYQPPKSTNSLRPTHVASNEPAFISAAPYPADVPKMKNDTQLSTEQSLELFSNIFKKLSDLASNNIHLTNEVIKRCLTLSVSNEDLFSKNEALLKHIVEIADKGQTIQPLTVTYSDKAEKLIKRCDHVYGTIPKEKLTDYHIQNEARLFKTKKAIQGALAETRDTSMKAILLRSEHVRRQPSFQTSVGAARFMLTKNGLSTEELKDEVDKLSNKVEKLSAIAEYTKRFDV